MAEIVTFPAPAPAAPSAQANVAKLYESLHETIKSKRIVTMVVILADAGGDVYTAAFVGEDRWRVVGALHQISKDILDAESGAT